MRLDKRLSKQWRRWWFEMPPRSIWRHCNALVSLLLAGSSSHGDNEVYLQWIPRALQWRHNERNGVSNHQRLDYLLNCLFRLKSKKTSKVHVSGLCEGKHQWPVDSPHKRPVTRKMFPFGDVIMARVGFALLCYGYVSRFFQYPCALPWRHNGSDSVSNHQPHDCLPNRLFRRRSKRTSKFRVTGLCAGNSPVTGEFPAQMASNAENVSIWWCHHGLIYPIFVRVIHWHWRKYDYPRTSAVILKDQIWHDDVIKWKHFPRYWPFVRGIHRSPVNSPHKGQWRGALMFCLIRAWINSWVNNCEAGDLRRYLAHCDVIVMGKLVNHQQQQQNNNNNNNNNNALTMCTFLEVYRKTWLKGSRISSRNLKWDFYSAQQFEIWAVNKIGPRNSILCAWLLTKTT